MTFTNDFEEMLNDYDIHVSERTRRLIRRNHSKMIKKQYVQYVPKTNIIVDIMWAVWKYMRFILSTIFGITLGIMAAVVWVCLFLANTLIEVYCVCLVISIMQAVIEQRQLN